MANVILGLSGTGIVLTLTRCSEGYGNSSSHQFIKRPLSPDCINHGSSSFFHREDEDYR